MARRILPSWTASSWISPTVLWTLFNLATAHTTTRLPNFQALYRHVDGRTSTLTCPSGWNFWTSGTYGGCCIKTFFDSHPCGIATQCHAGTVTDRLGGTRVCGSDYPDCFTMTVYESYPYAFNSWLVYDCGKDWFAHTVFREIHYATCDAALTVSAVLAANPTTTGVSYNRISQTQASPASGVGGMASPSSTGAGASASSSSLSSSKAWIAGAVAGPVVALVAGALGFWFGTRRKPPGTEQTVNNNRQVHNVGDGGEPIMTGAQSVGKQGSLQTFQAAHGPREASYLSYDYPSPSQSQPQRLSGLFPAYSPPDLPSISAWAAGVTRSRSTFNYGADAPEVVHEMLESVNNMLESELEK